MTKRVRHTLVITVTDASSQAFTAALDRLCGEFGATVGEHKTLRQSPELLAIGLDGALVDTLIGHGIDAVNQSRGRRNLTAWTETELLEQDGINYASMARIKQALYRANHTLKGERLEDYEQSIYRLPFRRTVTYGELKRAGIDTIDQFGEIELADAQDQPWFVAVTHFVGRDVFKPTSLDRPLAELMPDPVLMQVITQSGLTAHSISHLTIHRLTGRIKAAVQAMGYQSSDAADFARQIAGQFAYLGHPLPS